MSSPAEVSLNPDAAGSRRPGVVILLTAVVGLLALLSTTAGRPPGVGATAANRFLPADGLRVRYASPAGTLAGDWAVDRAPALIGQGPEQVSSWLSLTSLDWSTAVLARLSVVRADPAGTASGRSDDFYSVSAEGIRAEVSVDGDGTTQIFVPGRLDLSAAPKDQRWSSSGKLVLLSPDGRTSAHDYRIDYTSSAADGTGLTGCIVVVAEQRLDEHEPTTWQNTWCPGRGVVAFTAAGTAWTATDAPATAASGPAEGFDWRAADRLTFSPRRINNVGDHVLLGLAQPPVSLPDGTAVAIQNTSEDLVALDTSVATPPVRWRSRPGGRPTAVAAWNSFSVAATTQRELVAYGPDGDWRWAAPLSDLTVVPPVRVGGVIAVAGLDGTVTGYDPATGTVRWRRQVGIEIRVPMAAIGDRLAVVDQVGRLTCLDDSGAELWATDANLPDALAITTGADPVVVVPASDAPRISAYSLADGTTAWEDRTPIVARSLIGLDGQVVARDGNRTVSLDAATGATRWTWSAERTYNGSGGGDRVLLVTGSRLLLLDADGRQVREWPLSVGLIDGNNTWVSTSARHLLVFGPNGMVSGVTG